MRAQPCAERAVVAKVHHSRPGRLVLTYDGKAAPFPVVVRRDLAGATIPGQALAESFREGA